MKVIAIVFLVLMMCSATMAQDLYVTKQGFPAAMSKKTLSKFIDVWNADKAAGQQMINSGEVITLRGGINVFLMRAEIISGFVRIRPKGTTLEIWTLSKAIR